METNTNTSPRSVDDNSLIIDDSLILDEETNLSFRDFKYAAGVAFNFIKNKYNKQRISCSDALLELFNYNKEEDNDDIHLTSLYCLTLLMLVNKKNVLENEHYLKIVDYVKTKYVEKLN